MTRAPVIARLSMFTVSIIASPGVWAHHSYAPYDMTKTLKAAATVKEFYWGAPHSSASFLILGPGGKQQSLTLQGAAPNTMLKQGLSPRDIRKGMKVEITWHPLRSGEPGGTLATMKFEDGRVFADNAFGNVTPATAPATPEQ
jgi:hypothetical protein